MSKRKELVEDLIFGVVGAVAFVGFVILWGLMMEVAG